MDIDVFNSRLSPQYRIMLKEELDKLLSKYNIVIKDLPKIKSNDPAVKLLNAKEGDVLEIKRNSKTAGQYNYYRLVVK
ncbi:MAG: DNA-directed RNA polymerase subunit H [Candidatus Parvarchaeum sp.]